MTSSVIAGSRAASLRASSLRGDLVPKRHARTVKRLTPSVAATWRSPFSDSQFRKFIARIVHGSCAFAIADVHNLSPALTGGCPNLGCVTNADEKNPLSWRIGRRVAALRHARDWSLEDLARETKDRLPKSRLSNYEQGTRRLDIEGAVILAGVFGCSAAHILCLDDDQPILSALEARLIDDLRVLPAAEQQAYARRITTLALAYREAVPDEAMVESGFASPTHRKAKQRGKS